jgi:F-type H+-transporting ATPase subunit epsilon
MSELQVSILSPAKVVTRTKATAVQIPGALGYMGILPGHARLISEIGIGELTLEGVVATEGGAGGGGKQSYFVAGGYVDVGDDKVTILVDVVERTADIDVARAEKSKQRALERLESNETAIDLARTQASLARAQQRLAMALHGR